MLLTVKSKMIKQMLSAQLNPCDVVIPLSSHQSVIVMVINHKMVTQYITFFCQTVSFQKIVFRVPCSLTWRKKFSLIYYLSKFFFFFLLPRPLFRVKTFLSYRWSKIYGKKIIIPVSKFSIRVIITNATNWYRFLSKL